MATLSPTVQINVIPAVNPTHQLIHVTPAELRDILYDRKGSAFCSFVALYDMSVRDKKGQLSKMNKTGNPYIDNLFKIADTHARVTFDYAASMERRGDEASGKGNWSQAVIRDNGSLTPLSVHKKDVTSYNPMRFHADAPAYLRYEQIKSDSRFVDADGNAIEKDKVYPYLKSSSASTVDFHVAKLTNLVRFVIDGKTYLVDTD